MTVFQALTESLLRGAEYNKADQVTYTPGSRLARGADTDSLLTRHQSRRTESC